MAQFGQRRDDGCGSSGGSTDAVIAVFRWLGHRVPRSVATRETRVRLPMESVAAIGAFVRLGATRATNGVARRRAAGGAVRRAGRTGWRSRCLQLAWGATRVGRARQMRRARGRRTRSTPAHTLRLAARRRAFRVAAGGAVGRAVRRRPEDRRRCARPTGGRAGCCCAAAVCLGATWTGHRRYPERRRCVRRCPRHGRRRLASRRAGRP